MLFRSFGFSSVLPILAVCLTTTPHLAGADNGSEALKRLFTDQESRARIDAARKGDPVIANSERDKSLNKIRIDGVVIRENGENVVWVNGENSLKSNKTGSAHVNTRQIDSQNYRVLIRTDDKTLRLKPGQVWSGESGKVTDDY
jgi:hypothetical protein